MCYEVLGLTIAVRCENPDTMAGIRPLLARFPPATSASFAYELVEVNGAHVLRRNQMVIGTSPSRTTITDILLTDINALAIETFQGLAVHAGVVASSAPRPWAPGRSTRTSTWPTLSCRYATVAQPDCCPYRDRKGWWHCCGCRSTTINGPAPPSRWGPSWCQTAVSGSWSIRCPGPQLSSWLQPSRAEPKWRFPQPSAGCCGSR
jgi:hypothetical protein